MVDPNHVGVVQSDGITTPDVMRVKVGNVDVLDDDVGSSRDDSETLADDHTSSAGADQGLVGVDGDTQNTGRVIRNAGLGGIGLVVVTPAVQVDGKLAGGSGAPRGTSGGGGRTLGSGEVEGLGQDNDTRCAVTKVRDQLSRGGRVYGSGRTTTGNTLGETLSGARNANGGGGAEQRCCNGSDRGRELHADGCSAAE